MMYVKTRIRIDVIAQFSDPELLALKEMLCEQVEDFLECGGCRVVNELSQNDLWEKAEIQVMSSSSRIQTDSSPAPKGVDHAD